MKAVRVCAATVITCHANADWDALASMIALHRLYPDAVLLFPGSMELPLTTFFHDAAIHLYPFVTMKELELDSVRLLVLTDTAQPVRVPHVQPLLDRLDSIEVHVWDHHPQGDFGLSPTFACIDLAGSTCTLVAEAYAERGLVPTCEEATILGLGIYADTGSFSYESTSPREFAVAARLREAGMDVRMVADLVQHTMTSRHVRLLNALLDSAATHTVGALTMVMAVAEMDVFVSDFALLAQKFMEMESCDVLFALGNMDDKILVVARGRVPKTVDVGAVCRALGGGGHPSAASTTVKDMSLAEVKDALFREVFSQLHPERTARHIMSAPAVGLEDSTPILHAENLMTRYGLKAAPVFTHGTRQCIGYMEAQLAARAVSHGLGDMPVADYMQRHVFTVSPDATLQRLMDIIVGGRQRLVPVVENGETVGVVTRTDLISMFVQEPGRLPIRPEPTTERDLARILRTRLPRPVQRLLHEIQQLADDLRVNVFTVGGFVRDILLSRPAAEFDDVDIVVEGNGIHFAHKLAERLHGRVREHQAFMTALVIYTDTDGHEQRLDVATARLEYYKYPTALPTVELSSIKMDLFRRDFTINAMAIRLNSATFGRLVDFFGGQGDVQRRIIRVIHALSFVEDPTRILRAVRFEQRYGFHLSVQCEKLTQNAIKLELLQRVSGRRLLHELQLIFGEQAPQTSLARLNQLGVLAAIHPSLELNADRLALLERLREVLDWYRLLYFTDQPDLQVLYLLALTSGLSYDNALEVYYRLELTPPVRDDLSRLRETLRETLNRLNMLCRDDSPTRVSDLHALLSSYPLSSLLYIMARTHSDCAGRQLSQFICKWREVRADINGDDLRALGIPQGPRIAELLRLALAAKLDGLAPSRAEQLEWIAQQKQA